MVDATAERAAVGRWFRGDKRGWRERVSECAHVSHRGALAEFLDRRLQLCEPVKIENVIQHDHAVGPELLDFIGRDGPQRCTTHGAKRSSCGGPEVGDAGVGLSGEPVGGGG